MTIRQVFTWLRSLYPTPKPTAPRPYYIAGVLVRPIDEDDRPSPRIEPHPRRDWLRPTRPR